MTVGDVMKAAYPNGFVPPDRTRLEVLARDAEMARARYLLAQREDSELRRSAPRGAWR